MDGLISDDLAMFGQSVRRFAEREYGFGPSPHRLGLDRSRLRRLADLGCLSLALPEEAGGFGPSTAVAAAFFALGAALPPEPLVATGVHAAALLAAAARPGAPAHDLLPLIAAGETIVAVADLEEAARYDRTHVETVARSIDGGFVLDGEKAPAAFAAEADHIVVSARLEGELALFLVRPGPGVEFERRQRIDGLPAAAVRLRKYVAPSTARLDAMTAEGALELAADRASAAQAAEMVSIMDALIAATLDHARTRRQFGVAIGTFQALQHRIADMWMAAEEARSLACAAALAAGEDAPARRRAVSCALVVACDAAERVGNEAIQIHGAIGMTDEFIVGHWYRRLWALRQELGDRRSHLQRIASAG